MRHAQLCMTLLVCSLAFAQDNQQAAPVKQTAIPPKLPVIRLPDGSVSGLGPIYSQGTGFWIAATDRTAILASGEEFENVFAVGIAIRNTSSEMFTFDPAEVKAFDIIAGRYLTYIPAGTLAGKIRKPNAWVRFAQGFSRGATLASQGTYQEDTTNVTGDVSGRTYSGVTFRGNFEATATTGHRTCDAACVQARTSLLAQFAEEDERRAQKADAVETLGLGKETLLPNAQVLGYVYFSKPKKGRAPKPSGGQLDNSIDVNVIVPVGMERYRLFFPTALFDELTK